MLSQIHFKLRSQRSGAHQTVDFEGPFLTLSQLKKQIANKLGLLKVKGGAPANDFELKVTDAQSSEGHTLPADFGID